MARAFGDIGSTIFGFFSGSSDIYRSVNISAGSGDTSFDISRENNDDGTIGTALTVKQEFPKSNRLSSISVTSSDTDNPSVTIDIGKKLIKKLSVSTTICDPSLSFDIGFNNDKTDLDINIRNDFSKQSVENINIAASYDSLLNKKLLIGASVELDQVEQTQNYDIGAEYVVNDRISVGVLALDKLTKFDVGLSLNKFRGNDKNTLFGKVSVGTDKEDKPDINYSLGLRRTLTSNSNLDFMVSNNDTVNVVYNIDPKEDKKMKLSGFIAADLSFNRDTPTTAKLRYGINIE